MEMKEKLAYLKGLMEGLDFTPDTAERKVISSVVDILDDLIREVVGVSERLDVVDEYVTAIDEDLASLEEAAGVLPDLDDEEFDFDADIDEEDEDAEDEYDEDDDFDDDEDEEIYEVECPACGEMVYFDSSLLDRDELICPNCQETFSFEISDEDEEEDPSDDQ